MIPFKGAGWTEDHNCLFFNIPSALTGLGNQEESCYNTLTQVYGIYPLGTWDSQIDWVSQLNVWEAQQGNTEFKGTILCIGNGGCEFSLKNEDGTPDISTQGFAKRPFQLYIQIRHTQRRARPALARRNLYSTPEGRHIDSIHIFYYNSLRNICTVGEI